MKRVKDLYEQIIDVENIKLADAKARKGKIRQYGVQIHLRNEEDNIRELCGTLVNREYQTSPYYIFKIYEPKEREIYRLPYYPDRILHHAILNILEPMFVSAFTADTYSCIKGRGVHKASMNLRKALKDEAGTQYCLKLDIRKFYPSIDHEILKSLLRRKIKDRELLAMLDEIIDSAPGVPIGNYLSQYLANFYLTYFDHWIKEVLKVKYYFRYADDMVILSENKEDLHLIFDKIRDYLSSLKLEIKSNYQIFPVSDRGIDFVGYKHFHTHVLLRKSIKLRYIKAMRNTYRREILAAYNGWLKHCDSKNLSKKYENKIIKNVPRLQAA